MAIKPTVVMYPASGMGHLVPMVELAKLLLLHEFAVSVVLMESPIKHPSMDPFISRVSASNPSISFHHLPPPAAAAAEPASMFMGIDVHNPNLLQFLGALRRTFDVRAVVLDFFCTDALSVTAELGLPSYFFSASSASGLATLLYLPFLHSTTDVSFGDLGDALVHFPGFPPLPASHLPRETMRREDELYKALLNMCNCLPSADGILINSFEFLEAEAVRALRDGECVPGRRMPPVYCIGPLMADQSKAVEGEKNEKAECVAWLDEQPRGSVVFLCFGSLGSFSEQQLKAIATGLEKSGQRFLWVVKAPRRENEVPQQALSTELDDVLPEGFLKRTKQRGLVVKSWAPQVEVLNHEAVGGFVTHCGWNSVLEAVTAGVAMVAWPLYAEQRMNKVLLMEQAQLLVAMEGYDEEMVAAEEVERKVRWLIESEGGRERATAMKERAVEAKREGWSSRQAWLEVVKAFKEFKLEA
ncbi:hypothetical protein Cni_G25871 [Canna indica]|uniref:Glycosyltransferase n=1 Tax=Canna indica TaxID=4628 RepID=A0AAQ3KXX8_9LILI|nr:hypothetical protein Cni_G25871 [Canna indica]